MNHENETLSSILKSIRFRTDVSADEVADIIGTLDRGSYTALLASWRADYKALSQEIREARAAMKTGNEDGSKDWWQGVRQRRRQYARVMMAARSGIRELARRHAAAKRDLAA